MFGSGSVAFLLHLPAEFVGASKRERINAHRGVGMLLTAQSGWPFRAAGERREVGSGKRTIRRMFSPGRGSFLRYSCPTGSRHPKPATLQNRRTIRLWLPQQPKRFDPVLQIAFGERLVVQLFLMVSYIGVTEIIHRRQTVEKFT